MLNSEHPLPEWADPTVPADRLDAQGISRRGLLRTAGLLGAGLAGSAAGAALGSPAAAAPGSPAAPRPPQNRPLAYLVGDHHVHSVYSRDAKYTFSQLATRAAQFGLDWMVFTEHANVGHANAGGAQKEHEDVLKARRENPRLLIFQGLEWYIPAAEHGTVFSPPGPNEAELLRQFELKFDNTLTGTAEGAPGHPQTPANEALAVAGLRWLAEQKRTGFVEDVLVFANHPSRLGIDSPHEIRAWRDAAAGIAIGMEGAPGAQGAALPGRGATSIRGEYENSPSPRSWPAYPLEAYRTYGGFDWMTATVGGLWDAMLAEGRPWWITSNSDNHRTVYDTLANGAYPPGDSFETTGKLPDPVETGTPQPGSDFWPGQFSRTHVGVASYGYRQVMDGLRAGHVWVDHGQLIDGIDVRLRRDGVDELGATLGERLTVRRGEKLTLTVTITTSSRPNYHGVLPRLAHVDLIKGLVTGPATDLDGWRAPHTRVNRQIDVSGRTGTFTLNLPVTGTSQPFYLRLRGSDGHRNGPGPLGATIDPAGPIQHTPGDGDPWLDTWFYTNPIFVDVR